jgi:hypothetical protein
MRGSGGSITAKDFFGQARDALRMAAVRRWTRVVGGRISSLCSCLEGSEDKVSARTDERAVWVTAILAQI